ncbi:hypothetical protein [Flavobacterium sp. 7A]|uniref:hypothetical protein n=1 Tax=Flavobacterium sp. 7A TaxID=2940571 RepID=UPI002227B321|nr:hypothetical protein [Flavobacterium sp. 7A]MCW2118743.1 hypothetical protein [Flavobacterium sp. 7A]
MKTYSFNLHKTTTFNGDTILKIALILLLFPIVSVVAQNNDIPQYKGENFSLEGALALFKKAKSVEEFEKAINSQDNHINNLDLNNDGKTDYISINDIKENNAHILVLSTSIGKNTVQDIATINVEKSADDQANVQIIGDPNLYPSNTIVEPSVYNGAIASSNNTQEVTNNTNNQNTVTVNNQYSNQNPYNVWGWPLVQNMYNPYYAVWNSPYNWYNLPYGYNMWQPMLYSQFYGRGNNYRSFYHRTPILRLNYSRNLYMRRRGNIGYTQNFRIQNNFGNRHINMFRNNHFASRFSAFRHGGRR